MTDSAAQRDMRQQQGKEDCCIKIEVKEILAQVKDQMTKLAAMENETKYYTLLYDEGGNAGVTRSELTVKARGRYDAIDKMSRHVLLHKDEWNGRLSEIDILFGRITHWLYFDLTDNDYLSVDDPKRVVFLADPILFVVRKIEHDLFTQCDFAQVGIVEQILID
jgi:hypothetical protein